MNHSLNYFETGLISNLIPEIIIPEYPQELLQWKEIGQYCQESLTEIGDLDPQDWLTRIASQQPLLLNLKNQANNGQFILGIFPLMLFFADDFEHLTEKITQAGEIWHNSQANLEEVIIWSEVLALILREKLDQNHLFQQILQELKPKTNFKQQLEQLAQAWQENLPEQALLKLYKENFTEIGLSLYNFTKIPNDFRLCLTPHLKNPLIASLIAILAGLNNGCEGIPISWRVKGQKNGSIIKVRQQANDLWKAWIGIDGRETQDIPSTVAIAFPAKIQSRPSLKIISQQKLSSKND
jgi:hypothetical protein